MPTAHIEFLAGADIADSDIVVLEQDVLWLQISVSDAQIVHALETFEDFPGVLLQSLHGYVGPILVVLLQDILHAAVTKLKNSVLDDSLLGVNRVEEIDELHYIILVSQHIQDLELP